MATPYIIPLVLSICFYVAKVLVDKNGLIGDFIIFEGDYRNMYPYNENPQVTNSDLGLICAIPLISFGLFNLFATLWILFVKHRSYNSIDEINEHLETVYKSMFISVYFLLYTYMCLSCTMMFTEVIKNVVAMPRPNFFHMCDYKQINSNITFYNENINPGSIVDTSNCYADELLITDSESSFPSGHASYTLSIVLSHLQLIFFTSINRLNHIISFMGFFLAIYVGISRIMDYYHNVWDVLFGYFLAIIIHIVAILLFQSDLENIVKNPTFSTIKKQTINTSNVNLKFNLKIRC